MPIRVMKRFIQLEAAAGIILFVAAIAALIISNSPGREFYEHLLATKLSIRVDGYGLTKPLMLWINDGLMTIFFLLVGLEIKRELLVGELSSMRQVTLPAIAAIGGMIGPAAIYVAINHSHPVMLTGWAIPTATDIAFSLGILALLGSRIPLSLKIFLTALAIFDDLGAIIIIAIFYTAEISLFSLLLAGLCLLILFLMNRLGVINLLAYFVVGIILWLCVLKSGVHATLAGVALAFAIPLKTKTKSLVNSPKTDVSPLHFLEHKLHPWVAFIILPVFAFANAGVSLSGLKISDFFSTLPLGIVLGLFFGKQIGIFISSWLVIKTGLVKMPRGSNWLGIYGVALICGVGFTMSLFIGTLAFDKMGGDYLTEVRVGVLVGSLLSGLVGYLFLKCTHRKILLPHVSSRPSDHKPDRYLERN